ncbi:diguanylate cyclase [Shewanella canadensis]|uniref:diguanylate cyclase n=1 Tax=Shewanella canadensis TaxID=271096 RepID=A0A431WSQ2_9GAMM|nr:diguanylate cyclase [Shewanella canadensis]RTR38453.1 diguanylate cyclase [Shewanella canadensis]
MKSIKPLISLKKKIRLLFYIVVFLTLAIGLVSICLSIDLQKRVDMMINHHINEIVYALELSKESQKLQVISAKLSKNDSEEQRTLLLSDLQRQWQTLARGLEKLTSMASHDERIKKLNRLSSDIKKATEQQPLLEQLTETAIAAQIQASHLHLNMELIQKGFARSVQKLLGILDQYANTLLGTQAFNELKRVLDEHRQLAQFLHQGEELFRLVAAVNKSSDNAELNLLQRESMRHFLALKQHSMDSIVAKEIQSDWISQIEPNLVGEANIFAFSREALNSKRIADTYLEIQASSAQDIARFSSERVEEANKQVNLAGAELKNDSNSFVILIFIAGVLYTFLIWLTNWHFISKGIIQPVIATSNAMQAIAHEKTDTPLPKTNNLELQQMVSSLETLKSYAAQVKAISEIDGLTGAFNRRYFDLRLVQAIQSAHNKPHPLSIILFDVDNFKQFNDRYGHVSGDQCLKQISASMKEMPELQDRIFARYGGEEFIVFLPYTGATLAKEIAELMREKIFHLQIPHEDSVHRQHITVSIGVCTTLPNNDTTTESIIIQADKALYEAKQAGKNCVRAADTGVIFTELS